MDPHFAEYLAAVAGMSDLYGETGDDRPSDFHADRPAEVSVVAAPAAPTATVPAAGTVAAWDHEPSEEFVGSGVWI